MKRAEREHLKEDPFELFIAKLVNQIGLYRKQIILSSIAIVVLIGLLISVQYFIKRTHRLDNELLQNGMKIVESVALNTDQKIEELKAMRLTHSGRAASLYLHLANLYIAKGDRTAALEIVQKGPEFKSPILEEQRKMLLAVLLADEGKTNEAIDLLQRLLGNKDSTLNRDSILFRLGTFQSRIGNNDAAKEQYKRLIEEFPQSSFSYRAQSELEKLN